MEYSNCDARHSIDARDDGSYSGGYYKMLRAGTRRVVGLSETEVLAKEPLFSGLPAEELERLGALLRARRYARGEVIFLEGDKGTALCLIAEGRIRIQLTGTDGREEIGRASCRERV